MYEFLNFRRKRFAPAEKSARGSTIVIKSFLIGRVFGVAAVVAASISGASAAELNLYTTREPGLIQPLLDAFTKSTGTKVNTIFLKDGLAERVKSEGEKSPADVLMTVDIGNLVDLVDKGLTQPVKSDALSQAVPANLRDSNGNWFALSLRARTLYAAKGLNLTAFSYEQLADPAWKGKICIRAGKHPYNVGLVSAYLAHHGEEATEKWLTGVKANLARKASGGDRDVARDIKGGLCEIGIANSYYVGLMRSGKGGPEQVEWANAIRMILPTFKGSGTHVNVSGAAVAKHAPNKTEAVRFLEYLVSNNAQDIYAKSNHEYPVNPEAPIDPTIAEFGKLTPDKLDLGKIASYRKKAVELVEKVGFDN
jgi:iron(III) transport system substrate-binding protein